MNIFFSNSYSCGVLWEALALTVLWYLNKQDQFHAAHIARGSSCSLETMSCLLMQLTHNEAGWEMYYCLVCAEELKLMPTGFYFSFPVRYVKAYQRVIHLVIL